MVTTSVGAEGIEAADEILAIADSSEDFAKQVISMYNNTDRLRDIQGRMQEYIRKYFSADAAWERIREDF